MVPELAGIGNVKLRGKKSNKIIGLSIGILIILILIISSVLLLHPCQYGSLTIHRGIITVQFNNTMDETDIRLFINVDLNLTIENNYIDNINQCIIIVPHGKELYYVNLLNNNPLVIYAGVLYHDTRGDCINLPIIF